VIHPFQVLVLSLVFRTSYKMSDSLARASAAVLNRAWRQWFYAASVIAGALIGARYGLTEVAVGVSIAIILNFLMMLQLSIVLSGVSARTLFFIHVRHLVVAVITTLVAYAVISVARAMHLPEIVRLVVAGSAAGATWLLLAFLAPRLVGEELTWMISVVKSRIQLKVAQQKEVDRAIL
jgi:PST family polysaccharide transporter